MLPVALLRVKSAVSDQTRKWGGGGGGGVEKTLKEYVTRILLF